MTSMTRPNQPDLTNFISVDDRLPEHGQAIEAYNEVTGFFDTVYDATKPGKEWPMSNWGDMKGTWYPQASFWRSRRVAAA